MGTILRALYAKLPTKDIFGMKLRCCVLSISPPILSSRPGMSKNTDRRLMIMAFISATPRSRPMPNFMKVMAKSPAMVVRLDELMTTTELASDSTTASRTGRVLCACL